MNEKKSHITVKVVEIRGNCPIYSMGDTFFLDEAQVSGKICLHALASLATFLLPLRDGISPERYGIGKDEGYLQCPDPGPPYTTGGTVIFELKKNY